MAQTLGKESAVIGLDARGYLSGLKTMQTQTASSLAGIKAQFQSIKDIAVGFAGGAIVGTLRSAIGYATHLANAIGDYAQSGRDAVKSQALMAEQLGVSRDAAAALRTIGGEGSLPHFLKIQERFGNIRGEIAAGIGGEGTNALQRLGFDAEQFVQLRLDRQLSLVGDALRGVENAADRASIASSLFGREWREIYQLTRGGSGQMERIQSLARELGAAASNDTVNSLRGTSQELRELRMAQDLAAEGARIRFAGAFDDAALSVGRFANQLKTLRAIQPIRLEAAEMAGSASGWLSRQWRQNFSFEGLAERMLTRFPQLRENLEEARRLLAQLNHEKAESPKDDTASLAAEKERLEIERRRVEALRQAESEMSRIRTMQQQAQSPVENIFSELRRITGGGLGTGQQAALAGNLAQGLIGTAAAMPMLPRLLERGSVEAVSIANEAARQRGPDDWRQQLRDGFERAAEQRERQLRQGAALLELWRTGELTVEN